MDSKLYSIYGAYISKDGTRLNIKLVNGNGDSKEFATISLKLSGGKTAVQVDDKFGYLAIPMLKPEQDNSAVQNPLKK